MDRNEIIKAVNSIFVERFELEESELTPEKNIIEDLQLDSLEDGIRDLPFKRPFQVCSAARGGEKAR